MPHDTENPPDLTEEQQNSEELPASQDGCEEPRELVNHVDNMWTQQAKGTTSPFVSQRRSKSAPLPRRSKLPSIPFGQSRCKIACTLGPSPSDHYINDLLLHGMSIARINFSFGELEDHRKRVAAVRRVSHSTKRLCAIMVDTRGPSLRVGSLVKAVIEVKQGATLRLTSEVVTGDENQLCVRYLKHTCKWIPVGTLANIGGKQNCVLRVKEVGPGFLMGIVEQGSRITEGMRVTFEDLDLKLQVVSQQDVTDILYAANLGVDLIGVSAVKSAANVRVVRRILSNYPSIKIFAKIENQWGLENIDEIMEAADGICLYRGDLMESMAYDKVDAQHRAISEKCNQAGKTIITASQMLQSMIENMNPTVTEVREIGNAIDYGTDVFMLCSETSTGKNPIRAIATLSALLTDRELKLNYVKIYQKIFLHSWTPSSLHKGDKESIASSAVKTAFEINASIIIVLTQTGTMTRFVAKYRPACSIMCITDNANVARQCLCLRSTFPLLVGSMTGTESLIGRAVEVARDILRICDVDDKIVVAASVQGSGSQEEKIIRVKTINY